MTQAFDLAGRGFILLVDLFKVVDLYSVRLEFRDDLPEIAITEFEYGELVGGLNGHPMLLFLDEQKRQRENNADEQGCSDGTNKAVATATPPESIGFFRI